MHYTGPIECSRNYWALHIRSGIEELRFSSLLVGGIDYYIYL